MKKLIPATLLIATLALTACSGNRDAENLQKRDGPQTQSLLLGPNGETTMLSRNAVASDAVVEEFVLVEN